MFTFSLGADTHFVVAFVVQVVHWLTVDELLFMATLETAAVVHWSGGRVAAVRHLPMGNREIWNGFNLYDYWKIMCRLKHP